MGQEQTFTNVQPIQQTFSSVTPIDGSTQDDATSEPSFYEKLTSPFDSGAKNPVSRTLSAAGGAVIGAPANLATSLPRSKTIDQMADLLMPQKGQGAVPPKTNTDNSLSLWDSLKAWGDPNTWKGAASVLPEAMGTGIGNVAAAEGAGKISGALPSATRAGAALQDVRNVAGKVPIDMSKVGDTALEIYTQADRGATLPMSVRKLLNRVTKPNSPPLTYAEAKDFQSNISALSVDEKLAMKSNTQRLVGQLNSDLKNSLTDAADTVGKGQKFTQAMQEYHRAMQLRGMTDTAIDAALKAGLGTLGVGLAKKAWDAF